LNQQNCKVLFGTAKSAKYAKRNTKSRSHPTSSLLGDLGVLGGFFAICRLSGIERDNFQWLSTLAYNVASAAFHFSALS